MPNLPTQTPPPALPKQPPAAKNPAPATSVPNMPRPQAPAPSRNLNMAQTLPQPVIPSMARLTQQTSPTAPPRQAPPGQPPLANQPATGNGAPPAMPPRSPQPVSPSQNRPVLQPPTPTRPPQMAPSTNAPGVPNRVVPAAAAGVAAGSMATNAANAANLNRANSGNANLPPAPPKPAAPPPPPAAPAKSILRFLPFVLIGLVVLLGGIFLASKFLFNKPTTSQTNATPVPAKQVTLTYWGLWEPSEVMNSVISDYESANPGVKIVYKQETYKDYRERLQTAIASGNGPDIFRFHASWVPMLTRELSPMPDTVFSIQDFQAKFYPAAVSQLTSGSSIVGVPLMYDGLALYYNADVLKTANASPPTTWAELKTLAKQLTIRSSSRKLERAGVALGNSTNVEHFSDIIALLMLQNGATLDKPNTQAGQEAIKFYTDFYTVDKVWDETLPSSTVAFAREETAMMIAPSWRAHEIKAQNPNLNFGIAPVPQLSARKVSWASYWAEGVSQSSRNKAEAWKFLKYLSQPETLRKFSSSASQSRPFGEIYPQREMANDVGSDQYVSSYLIDAPYAQGGFMSSFTHDNGLNDNIIRYYQDAVTAMTQGRQALEAMQVVEQGVIQELRQYGLAPAEVAPVAP